MIYLPRRRLGWLKRLYSAAKRVQSYWQRRLWSLIRRQCYYRYTNYLSIYLYYRSIIYLTYLLSIIPIYHLSYQSIIYLNYLSAILPIYQLSYLSISYLTYLSVILPIYLPIYPSINII